MNKYVIRWKRNDDQIFYYSGTGITEFDIRINKSIIFDDQEYASIDLTRLRKKNDDGLMQIIAVTVKVTPVRADT